MRFSTQDLAMMRTRQAPRDVAILASLVLPPEVTLSVRTDEGVKSFNPPASKSESGKVYHPQPPPPTFTDRIASSPQLVSATITRAIKAKRERERLAARKPVMGGINILNKRVC
jgi:hypothetical protein